MALSASKMAEEISSAIDKLSKNPIFKAKCIAGADVTVETWEAICQQIINHLKSNMEITIPSLTVNSGITVSGTINNGNSSEETEQQVTLITSSTGSTQQITLKNKIS